MRALCYHGKHDIRYDTVPDPIIEDPRDAIIRVSSCAICGSDLHLYNGFVPGMESGDTLRNLSIVAGSAVFGLTTLSSQANATAFAYSALEVSNFFLDTSVFSGFDTFQFTSQPLSASLNGTTINSPSIIISNDPAGSTNQAQLTLGDTPFAADNLYFGANRPTFEKPPQPKFPAWCRSTSTTFVS